MGRLPKIKNSLTSDDAKNTYVASFPVPAATGDATTDTANVAAVVAKARAAFAFGSAEVVFPSCPIVAGSLVPYNLPAGLPAPLSGDRYRGVEPLIQQIITAQGSGWLADGEWNYVGGTVIKGDGTAPALAGNNADQGSPSANLGLTELHGVSVVGVGFDTFTYGIWAGAANIMGVTFGELDKLYFKNMSQWAVRLVNFAHLTVGKMFACLSQNGMYFGSNLAVATFEPGNSRFGELYVLVPRDGRDSRLCRGVVFEATAPSNGAGQLSEMQVNRLQVNRFGTALLSVTAGFTNTSTAISVPDGTKFAVGMPVVFTTTGNGVTASLTYTVLSVAGNNITIGATRTGAAITGTGTGNLTLQSYGYANVEVTAATATSRVTTTKFLCIDSEGSATNALYMENASACHFGVMTVPVTVLTALVARGTIFSRIESRAVSGTDFDAGSSAIEFHGNRSSTLQYPGRGHWYDSSISTFAMSIWPGLNANKGGDLQVRTQGFTYPTIGMGERIFPRDSALTLAGFNGPADVVFNGGAGVTFTLPTIVTDTVPANSHLGLWFDIWNVSANSLTIATDGTQTFNKVGAKVTTTLAAGSSMKVIACKDNSGNLFWAARQTSNTLP